MTCWLSRWSFSRPIRDLLSRYRRRFNFVLVDEYQDTNRAQFRFVELLASEHQNLMVVGDDDQSIYGWRGADIRNILDFETAFLGAHVVRLEQNYRSTEVILSAANTVIAENMQRKGKTLRTDRAGGERITLLTSAGETDEARWICDQIEGRLAEGPRSHASRGSHPLSHQRPIPGAGGRVSPAGLAVPDRRRSPVLRAS